MVNADEEGFTPTKAGLYTITYESKDLFGNVSIPFREFKNNSACTSSIGIRFDDGSATSGSIKFLPESFL